MPFCMICFFSVVLQALKLPFFAVQQITSVHSVLCMAWTSCLWSPSGK
jgi:hypothetical protein